MSVKIRDLIQLDSSVELAPGHPPLPIRGLSLEEMLSLFMSHQDAFMALYDQGQKTKGLADAKVLAPFLLAAPEFVTAIIATASGTKGQEDDIRLIPATAQLIALKEIWHLSVPDPKKASELWSEVMAQLQKLSQTKAQAQPENQISPASNETSAESLNSSAPADTASPT